MMKKILITGGSGLLGSNIAKLAVSRFDVFATYNTHVVSLKGVNFLQADLRRNESIDVIRKIAPDIIIHTAALTNLDVCEENPDDAYAHNVLASRNVAQAAKESGAYLIHISTDCVFDGEKGSYAEGDATNPLSVYAKTKLQAEQEVLSADPSACVVRTNIFGWNKLDKLSLAEWMIATLKQEKELLGFRDVVFSPILVNDLIPLLFKLYEKKYAGILHVGAQDTCSKLEFACMIADLFGFDRKNIKSVSYRDVALKAPRAKNLSLDISKARIVLSCSLPDIRSGLKRMKQLQDAQYIDELKNG
jgi:dTDP-4-dehydrorhamnose reductase